MKTSLREVLKYFCLRIKYHNNKIKSTQFNVKTKTSLTNQILFIYKTSKLKTIA
jgi:hypothetical protein